MSGNGDGAPWESLGEPHGLGALRERNPEWDIRRDGPVKVTAVLRDDVSVSAVPLPVSVAVMANVLLAWRVEQGREASRH